MYYSITGDDIAQQFFYLDAETGVITLKRLLTDDTSLQYNVSPSLQYNVSPSLQYNVSPSLQYIVSN